MTNTIVIRIREGDAEAYLEANEQGQIIHGRVDDNVNDTIAGFVLSDEEIARIRDAYLAVLDPVVDDENSREYNADMAGSSLLPSVNIIGDATRFEPGAISGAVNLQDGEWVSPQGGESAIQSVARAHRR